MRGAILLALCAVASAAPRDPQCDASNSLERFDCFPEDSSNEQGCVARGCCWNPPSAFKDSNGVEFPPLNVPYCFYPKNFQGYSIVNTSFTGVGLTAYLKRVNPSGIDTDINLLRVEVIEQTNAIARIRITDASKPRWEPPVPAIPATDTTFPKYVVQITTDAKLEVNRFGDSGDTTTLVSLDLASMVYTNNFIQVSSKLPSQVVYGLGEHKGSLRRSTNFSRFTFYNEDRSPAYNERLYGTHPLYINIEPSGRANGVWLFNSNAMDVILQPTPAITYRPVGGILDFFVFVGPTPGEVVKQYQQMVGNPKMVPYWSLGYHLCRFGYKSTEDTRSILQRNLDAGIRIDTQWSDIDYMDRRNDFTIDPVNYKDLPEFAEELHKDGRHYVVIIDPAVSGGETPGTYPPFDRGLDYDVFVKDINGKVVHGKVWNRVSSVFPDFTHPNATPYWTEMFVDFYKTLKFDGAWIDMNEPSNIVDGHINEGCPGDNSIVYIPGDEPLHKKTLCSSDQHHWSSHYDVHNMYGFTEAIATYNALETMRPNKRPFIISRSSFSGHGYYAGHWTGDIFSSWTDLKDSVPGILEFSFYGVPMVGADICGFNLNTTVELCSRWQALGAFYPFSRNHNSDSSNPQDPVALGEKVVTVTKNAYYWRYKLLPHLYTLFYQAHVSGETVARPLFFEYPEDPNTYDNDEQFLWGDSLMVVPALHENQTSINAYFPKGVWYDLQNRTATVNSTAGGKYVSLPAYDDTIQFFMKGGSAVFFQEPGNTTTDSRENPFGLYVFLGDSIGAFGEVYIDDGESIDAIEKKNYQLVQVIATEKALIIGTHIEKTDDQKKDVDQKLDRVHMYGVKSKPVKIYLMAKEINDFVYDASRQLLTIYNIDGSLQNSIFTIEY